MQLPPTSVTRVPFPYSSSHLVEFVVGSLPAPSVFLRILQFSSIHTTQLISNFNALWTTLKHELLARETGQASPMVLDVKGITLPFTLRRWGIINERGTSQIK